MFQADRFPLDGKTPFGRISASAASCILILVAWNLVAAGRSLPPLSLHRQMRYLMGTLCEIQVYDADPRRAEQAIQRAFEAMQQVDHLLSNYDPNSELSLMNRSAHKATFQASAELYEFLKQCRQFYRLSFGAFDPTVGPLVRAWKFFTPNPEAPTPAEISAARTRVGFDKVELKDDLGAVRYTRAGMEIDPGGIGKGFAIDRAARVLREQGIKSALLNAGRSTFYAIGRPPGREGWLIGIQDPGIPRRALAWAQLRDNSLSTSGDTEKFVQTGSHRYGHIFDPRTGQPVEGIYEVSVIAPTATESDALTKAVCVLPRSEAFQIIKKRTGVHALRLETSPGGSTELAITPWSHSEFKGRSGGKSSPR